MDELWIEILAGLGVGTGMGLVGAGGAIFTVPVFGVVLGHPSKSAFLEALAVTGTVAASSGAWSALRGRVDWQRVVIFGGAGIVGSQLAAPVAVHPPGCFPESICRVSPDSFVPGSMSGSECLHASTRPSDSYPAAKP